MGTHALFAPVLVAVSTTGSGDAAAQEDPIIFNLWPPVRVTPVLNPSPVLASARTTGEVRAMRVAVSPTAPGSSDLVFVTILAEASRSDLVLNRTTVDKHGSEIKIDLHWSSPDPAEHPADKEYKITEPLGSFGPGLYQVQIRSHGALQSEASTLFNIRAPRRNGGSHSQPSPEPALNRRREYCWQTSCKQ